MGENQGNMGVLSPKAVIEYDLLHHVSAFPARIVLLFVVVVSPSIIGGGITGATIIWDARPAVAINSR
jgi:hypothetical protein